MCQQTILDEPIKNNRSLQGMNTLFRFYFASIIKMSLSCTNYGYIQTMILILKTRLRESCMTKPTKHEHLDKYLSHLLLVNIMTYLLSEIILQL